MPARSAGAVLRAGGAGRPAAAPESAARHPRGAVHVGVDGSRLRRRPADARDGEPERGRLPRPRAHPLLRHRLRARDGPCAGDPAELPAHRAARMVRAAPGGARLAGGHVASVADDRADDLRHADHARVGQELPAVRAARTRLDEPAEPGRARPRGGRHARQAVICTRRHRAAHDLERRHGPDGARSRRRRDPRRSRR